MSEVQPSLLYIAAWQNPLAQKGAPLILSALPREQGMGYPCGCCSWTLGCGLSVCCPEQHWSVCVAGDLLSPM